MPPGAPPRVRYRHRHRVHAAVFAVAVLLVLALGAAAGAYVTGLWQWPGRQSAGSPEPVECPPEAAPAAPVEQAEVNVYNSTNRRGLAAGVAQGLRSRGFPVLAVDNDPLGAGVQEPAQVRHGPQGLPAARTVAAQVDGAVLLDDGREGAAVDLVLGAGYRQLRGPAQAAEQVQPTPAPQGCTPPAPASSAGTSPATQATATPAP